METTAFHNDDTEKEHKLDVIQDDENLVERRCSRGVHRALFPADGLTRNLSEQEVNSIVRDAVKELAREGKRVALAPKRMGDGIAIDWIYDISIRDQNLDDIVRAIPRSDNKTSLHTAPELSQRGPGRRADDPIVIDIQQDTSSSMDQRSKSHTPDLKRKTVWSNQLTLRNLSRKMDEAALQNFLVERGIPLTAILGIRLRSIGGSTTATVDIQDGYSLRDRNCSPSWDIVSSQFSRNSTPTTISSTPSIRALPDTPRDGSPVNAVTKYDFDHEVIDLVSDESDMDISEPEAPNVEIPPPDADGFVSPALSYLTLDDTREDGADLLIPKDEPADHHIQNHDPRSDSDSSDDTESDDDDRDPDRRESPRPPRADSPDDLAQRLLYGPIDIVDDLLAHETEPYNLNVGSASDDLRNKNDGPTDGPAPRRGHPNAHESATRRRRPESDTPRSTSQDRPDRQDANAGFTINLPKTPFAKGRRLLVSSDKAALMTAVYMRGDVQFIDQTKRVRISRFSLPIDEDDSNNLRHVVDAVSLNQDLIAVGYNEGRTQVSCIALNEDTRPIRHDLRHRAHNTVHEHRRAGNSSLNRGISAMCLFNERSSQFLSGGEDGAVHLWTISDTASGLSAASAQLAIRHSQPIHCIAHRASDQRVFTCYSQYIHSADFEVGASASTSSSKPRSDGVFLSSRPQQVHIHPQNPAVIILEVDHRDRQVQIYDTRKSNFRAAPCIEFGYQTTRSHEGTRRAYRFFKGSTVHSLFARGYQNGVACVWDYRKPQAILERFHQQRNDSIEHAVLQDSETLMVYGGHTVTFWSINNS